MTHHMAAGRTLEAAGSDARQAVTEYDNASEWLGRADVTAIGPLAAEVWVFDTKLSHALLVKHRWRGWVSPGGKVDAGETPREGASRELLEETGIRAELLAEPAAVTVRSYRPGWSATMGVAFAAVVDQTTPLTPENGQPAAWLPLDEQWQGYFPEDRLRMTRYAALLARNETGT
ncbi:NUDIX hydrolase [Streptomyces sp. NPDC055287]